MEDNSAEDNKASDMDQAVKKVANMAGQIVNRNILAHRWDTSMMRDYVWWLIFPRGNLITL